MKSIVKQKNLLLVSFLFIPLLLMGVFVIYPSFQMIKLSFTDWNGSSASYNFVGLENYFSILFKSPDVWGSLKNNFAYMFFGLALIPAETLIAVFLNSKLRGMNAFKSIIFLPYIINGVAISYAFSFFYSPQNGGLNGILNVLGMGWARQNWLSNINIVNFSLVGVFLWRNFGFFVVLFIAGLQTIPQEIIEAAIIDGANRRQQFIHVIIPNLTKVIEAVLFMNIIWSLNIFDIPFVMTSGGPGHASSTFSTYAIETAFNYNGFGMANAMSVVLMMIMIIFLILQNRILRLRK